MKLTYRLISLSLILATFSSMPAKAEDLSDLDVFRSRLGAIVNPDNISHLQASKIPGLYEVGIGARVLYISENLDYMLNGDMIELASGKNITDIAKSGINLEIMKAVDPKDTIIFAAKDNKPKHVIDVFTDVECGYCAKLHQDVPALNEAGVEVRYLFFPRRGVNSPAYSSAVGVWCAADQQQAMDEAKANGSYPAAQCDNPVLEHMQLVRELRLSGTPAIITETGHLIPGYMAPDKLLKMLDEESSS